VTGLFHQGISPAIIRADGGRVPLDRSFRHLLAIDPHGRVVCGLTQPGKLGVFDAQTGTLLRSAPMPNGGYVALGGERPGLVAHQRHEMVVVDGITGESVELPFGGQDVIASPDGRRLAILEAGREIRVVDLETNQVTSLDTEEPAWQVAFSPEGSALLVGGSRGGLSVWDTSSGLLLFELDRLVRAPFFVLWGPKGWAAAYAPGQAAWVYSIGPGNRPLTPSAGAFACPPGSRAYGTEPPFGRYLFCEDAAGQVTLKHVSSDTKRE
jgi:WD40 repeat protein